MTHFLFLPFILGLCAAPTPVIPPDLEMVGYQGNHTVFHSYEKKDIYLLKGDSFEQTGTMEGWVRSVSGDFMLASIDSSLLLKGEGTQQLFNLQGRPWGAAVSASGDVFYVDGNFLLRSPSVQFSKPLSASDVLYIEGSNIFYSLDTNEDASPQCRIHRYDLKTGQSAIFGDRFADEPYIFFKGKNMFYALRLMDGEFRPVLYDMSKRRLIRFTLTEEARINRASCAFFNAEKNYFGIIEDGHIVVIRQF